MFVSYKALFMSAFVLSAALAGPAFAEADDQSAPSSAPLNATVNAANLEPGLHRRDDLAVQYYTTSHQAHAMSTKKVRKQRTSNPSEEYNGDY